jgi:predicted nucleic acid-binding protein
MSWLLDTPVVSELIRTTPKASVIDWLQSQDEDDLFLSVLTLGELERASRNSPIPAAKRHYANGCAQT